jgi:hypothetical protein
MSILTWSTPTGIAADKTKSFKERREYYYKNSVNRLWDNTLIVPNILCMEYILQAYDDFGPEFPVVISHGYYLIHEQFDF